VSTAGGLRYLDGCNKVPGGKREGLGEFFSIESLEHSMNSVDAILVAAPMVTLTLTALTGASSESSKANNDDKRIEIASQSGIREGTSAVARSEILLSTWCSIALYVT
jgi:hypothetical protein